MSLEKLDEFIRDVGECGEFVLDLETSGLSKIDDRILGFALQAGGNDPIWVPTEQPSDLAKVREKLQPLLLDPEAMMIGHNLPFDVGMLVANNFEVENRLADTMVAAHLINENRRLERIGGMGKMSRIGLKKLVYEELGHRMNTLDEVGGLFGPDLGTYAADDARQTWRLWKHYEKQMKDEDERLLDVFHKLDMPLIPMIVEMEITGVEIDAVHLRQYDRQLEGEQIQVEKEIHSLAGKEFKVSSAVQVSEVLFDHLGLPTSEVPFSGKTGRFSTDRRVLTEFLAGIPIVDKIVEWRSKSTHRRTFVRGLLNHSSHDGRFRAHFNLTGTKIGRLCVDGDTVLETSAGPFKIKDLDLDLHQECTILTHKGRHKRILAKHYKGEEEMYEVEDVDGGRITCTMGHRFLTVDGWSSLEDIGLGGAILTSSRATDIKLSSGIIRITPVGKRGVWDISVEDDESYVAHGFINHNSSSRPLNLQNMPRTKGGIRYAFIAAAGKVIVAVDLSQIELRLCAHYTQDAEMASVYNTGGVCDCSDYKKTLAEKGEGRCAHVDIHTRTAHALNVPRAPVAKGCVTGDSLILTPEGLLRFDEFVPQIESEKFEFEKEIISKDGVRKTTHATFRKQEEVFDVETEMGFKVRATSYHEFEVVENGRFVKKQLKDLKVGDCLPFKIGTDVHGTNTNLPEVDPICNTSHKHLSLPKKLTPEISRFFGYYVSEGRINYHGEVPCVTCASAGGNFDEGAWADMKACASFAGNRLKEQKDGIRNRHVLTVSSVDLERWLMLCGVGHDSTTQAIPKAIRTAPFGLKREFLRAVFEGDGSVKVDKRAGRLSYTSKSETLVRQLHSEMINIGILSWVTKGRRVAEGKDCGYYWVWNASSADAIKIFAEKIGCISDYRQKRLEELVLIAGRKQSRGARYRDGFAEEAAEVRKKVKRREKDAIRFVQIGKCRLTDNTLERYPESRRLLCESNETFAEMDKMDLWTLKIRSIEPAGVEDVYDVYEPTHAVAFVNGLLVGDCNFGLLYGMQPKLLKTYAKLPTVEEAARVREGWFDLYAGVREFHATVARELEDGKRIYKTLFGRRRRLHEEYRVDPHRAFRQAVQFMISGSSQDLLKLSTIEILKEKKRRALEDPRWAEVKFILQIHDELVLEAPEEIGEEVLNLVVDKMENGPQLRVPILASGSWSNRWEGAKV